MTPKDLQDAFESQYGDKLRCRMIMVDTLEKAKAIWEELHKNPGSFETLAKDRSMDPGSRSLGGLLGEPITRHAIPKNLTDKAFEQLVNGDPKDKDPTHKPKDGDFTGPIQASESVWVILRREEITPALKNASLKDKGVHEQVYEMIYQVKLKETMEGIFQDLIREASIENRLTGMIKMAKEERDPDFRVDGDVKLMGNRGNGGTDPRANNAVGTASTAAKIPPPVALSPEAARQFRPLKPGGNPTAPPLLLRRPPRPHRHRTELMRTGRGARERSVIAAIFPAPAAPGSGQHRSLDCASGTVGELPRSWTTGPSCRIVEKTLAR